MRRSWFLMAGLALFALCFGQSYAIVHVHHAHGHSALPVEFSVHPLDIDPAHIPLHHSHDHHGHHPAHEDDDPHAFDGSFCKWFLTRSQQSVPVVTVAAGCVRVLDEAQARPFVGISPHPVAVWSLSDQWRRCVSDPRSPPSFA